MSSVVEGWLWPRMPATVATSVPPAIIRLAAVCPYGIITTNRKSPVYQGFSVIWQGFFILFQTEKSSREVVIS